MANPAANAVNSSTLCGRYVRNASQQYDVLQYTTAAIPNAAAYYTNQKKFYIDIYTNAPPNTQILLQLENSNTAAPDEVLWPLGYSGKGGVFSTGSHFGSMFFLM